MTLIEFANFMAMLLMAMVVIRSAQILGRNTWVSPALGALFS